MESTEPLRRRASRGCVNSGVASAHIYTSHILIDQWELSITPTSMIDYNNFPKDTSVLTKNLLWVTTTFVCSDCFSWFFKICLASLVEKPGSYSSIISSTLVKSQKAKIWSSQEVSPQSRLAQLSDIFLKLKSTQVIKDSACVSVGHFLN